MTSTPTIPPMDEMSEPAREQLSSLCRQFAAVRSTGADFLPRLVAADRTDLEPVVMVYEEDVHMRVVTTATAAAVLAARCQPREVLWANDMYIRHSPDVPASEDPARGECLCVAYANRRGRWLSMLPYGRADDGRLTWSEPEPWARLADVGLGRAIGVALRPVPAAVLRVTRDPGALQALRLSSWPGQPSRGVWPAPPDAEAPGL